MASSVVARRAVAIWFAVRRRFAQNGASLVEYALLLALIAVAALLALYFLGGSVSNSLNNSGNTLFPTS